MDKIMDLMKTIESIKSSLIEEAKVAVEKNLTPFFEKYPKISAVVFANEERGDDEGEDWLQFQFYVEIDGKQQDSCNNYDDDIYIAAVVRDIPLELGDMVNIFGTEEVEFENGNVQDAAD